MEIVLLTAIGAVSLVSGIASARLGLGIARNPDAADRRTLSERELGIFRWLLPVGFFVLGAIFPLFFFAALGLTRRSRPPIAPDPRASAQPSTRQH